MKRMIFKKYSVILAAIFVFLAMGVVAAHAEQYAVLIGVNEYVDDGNLNFAVQDVEALRDVLLLIGYKPENVYCLTSGSRVPTLPLKSNIEFTINAVLKKAKPGDTVIILMTGHGLEVNGQPQFCPSDTRSLRDLVSINDIMKAFQTCPATQKLMIIDACRSTTNLPAGAMQMQPLPSPTPGVMLLQSCAKGETSIEWGLLKHGIFTFSLLEGFREAKNRDGDVTLLNLVAYATKRTQEIAAECDHQQTPYMLGNLTDFVLVPRGTVLPKPVVDTGEIAEARKYLETMIQYQIDDELKKVDVKDTEAKLKIRNSIVSMINENNLLKENLLLLLRECRSENDRTNLEYELIDVPLDEKYLEAVKNVVTPIMEFEVAYRAALEKGSQAVVAFLDEKIKAGVITGEETVAGYLFWFQGTARLVPGDQYPLKPGKHIYDAKFLSDLQNRNQKVRDDAFQVLLDGGIIAKRNGNRFEFFFNGAKTDFMLNVEIENALQGIGKYLVAGVAPSKYDAVYNALSPNGRTEPYFSTILAGVEKYGLDAGLLDRALAVNGRYVDYLGSEEEGAKIMIHGMLSSGKPKYDMCPFKSEQFGLLCNFLQDSRGMLNEYRDATAMSDSQLRTCMLRLGQHKDADTIAGTGHIVIEDRNYVRQVGTKYYFKAYYN